MDLTELTISQIHNGLKRKEFSVQELTKAYLKKIKSEDEKIGAFLEVSEDLAFAQAKKVDDLISQGKEIPLLAGIPAVIKDNILVKDLNCTAGSKILEGYKAPYDATCIKKLKEQEVVILGKANLDEFGMGAEGASEGSATAVRTNECCFALGSDTGGSIRQPAGFCGVVGLKPTYGAVSRYGLIAFASSLDQIGPITKNVEDAEIVFNAIKGKDPRDSTSVEINLKSEILNLKSIKIGVPKEYFTEGIEPEVEKVIKDVIEKVEKQGAKIEEISLPHTKYANPCYYIISTSEASANLARYDGIKYGKSEIQKAKSEAKNLLEVYLKTRGEGFGDEVKRRIMLGTYALSAGYYEAYYLRAQKVRTLIKQDFEKAFQKVDVIFTPVSPFLVSVNLAGLPGLSLPVGVVGKLPVGLQIIGKPFSESEIFKIGKSIEEVVKRLV